VGHKILIVDDEADLVETCVRVLSRRGYTCLRAYAGREGLALIDDRELTSYLTLQRPCDRLIAAFVRLGRGIPFRSPWWDSWVGGHAIQQCLLTGLVQYRFLIFEKVA
jgi:CheY-like chemotaxis protein